MADTYTPHYNLVKPSIGGDPNTWGDLLNGNADILDDVIFGKLDLAGGTMTGPLVLAADPTEDMQAATKQYVDAVGTVANAAYPKTGGTLTGNVRVNLASPTIELRPSAAAQDRIIQSTSPSGQLRWMIILGDTVAESGNNVGSRFAINLYNDSGAYVMTPLLIDRSSGIVQLAVRPQWAGFAPWDSGNFNPASKQDAGNYVHGITGNNFGQLWDGTYIHHYVDGVDMGGIWDTRTFNPANYQPAGNYVRDMDGSQRIGFSWDNGNRLTLWVDGVGYAAIPYDKF